MSGGAYSALSGMRNRLEQLDRLASDLANISTAGYKTERVATAASRRESFSTTLDSAVDVVRGGAKTDYKSGAIAATGRDLDVAIDGRGFFVIETAAGERYTRNGAFSRNADGVLTTSDGETVLGEEGEIRLGKGAISVEEDGTIRNGSTIVGHLKIVEFSAETDLLRESGTRFRAVAGADVNTSTAKVIGGSLEQSNVSVVDRMAALTEMTRGFEGMQRGVSVLMNDIDSRAISELARR
jgi:flagellar basal-body rod protein FlgF